MTLAIVAALAVELAPMLGMAHAAQTERRVGQPVYRGQLGDRRVVLAELGIGKVRAAAGVQALIERHAVSALILYGSAGAVNPKHAVGTVIVAERLIQHDFGLLSKRSLLGWGWRQWVHADAALSRRLLEAGKRLGQPALAGKIVTGDQSIAHDAARHRLWTKYRADSVEMEGAAVAMVCKLNGVPCAVARGLTDRADEKAVRSFRRRIRDVSQSVAEIVAECVRLM